MKTNFADKKDIKKLHLEINSLEEELMAEDENKKPDEMEQFLKRGFQVKPKLPEIEIKDEEGNNTAEIESRGSFLETPGDMKEKKMFNSLSDKIKSKK